MKKITVETTLSKDGRSLVAHVQGIKGDGCKEITDALAQAHEKLEEKETSESYEHEPEVRQVTYTR